MREQGGLGVQGRDDVDGARLQLGAGDVGGVLGVLIIGNSILEGVGTALLQWLEQAA